MKRVWTAILCAFGLLILILDTKTALMGAYDGLTVCIQSVIPSLFPFFVLSGMLTGVLMGTDFKILAPIGRLCGMPRGSESILLTGLIGGYPIGAQAVSDAYNRGQLCRKDALRMLGFCSNAGPSFLFGMVACKFSSIRFAWLLWGIHIVSAILTGILLPEKSSSSAVVIRNISLDFASSMQSALKAMAAVCGWVILFRCVITFLQRWILWLLPVESQVAVIGILELANGCLGLDSIASENNRFIVCSGILALGGVCVAMQTASVTGKLGMGYYFFGKLLQCVISLILSSLIMGFYFSLIPAVTAIIAYWILHKKQKNSSNRAAVGV